MMDDEKKLSKTLECLTPPQDIFHMLRCNYEDIITEVKKLEGKLAEAQNLLAVKKEKILEMARPFIREEVEKYLNDKGHIVGVPIEEVRTELSMFEDAMTYDGRAPMEDLLLGSFNILKQRLLEGQPEPPKHCPLCDPENLPCQYLPPGPKTCGWGIGDDLALENENGIVLKGSLMVPKDKAYLMGEMGVTFEMGSREAHFDPHVPVGVVSITGLLPKTDSMPPEPEPEAPE